MKTSKQSILILLSCALAIRLLAYALFGGILHPDEIFQYTEQAHRLVFGQGIVPWEYRAGIRSWLFPGMLAGIMQLARLVGSGPVVQNGAIAFCLCLASLPGIACCAMWGAAAAGRAGGVTAGLLAACWSEAVLMSVHPLLDGVGGDCLVPGIFLLQRAAGTGRRLHMAQAGLLLGVTLAFRLQLAPAVAVCWLIACGARPRWAGLPVLLWMCLPLLLSGLLDWVTLGAPFQSVTRYLAYNSRGAASFFGTGPWYDYLRMLAQTTGWLSPLMALCICFGATRLPLVAAAAVSIVFSLSLVAHKEFRFILPALPFLLTLAGAGSAIFASWLGRCLRMPDRRHLPAILAVSWIVLCAAHARAPQSARLWVRGEAMVAEMHEAAADPAACALAIAWPSGPSPWYVIGGETHLRPGMDLLGFDASTPKGRVVGFDYAIAPGTVDMSVWGLSRVECRPATNLPPPAPTICLWHNAGGCTGARLPEMHLADPPFLKK